MLCCLFSEMQT